MEEGVSPGMRVDEESYVESSAETDGGVTCLPRSGGGGEADRIAGGGQSQTSPVCVCRGNGASRGGGGGGGVGVCVKNEEGQ